MRLRPVGVAVVLPTIAGREESCRRSLAAYQATLADVPEGFVIHVEHGHPTCGAAWQAGAEWFERSWLPRYLHFAADDIEPLPGWWRPLAETADAGYCPCAVVLNPDETVQSAGMSGWQPHTDEPEDGAQVEHTLTPFLTWQQWQTVKPIPAALHFCTDTWVSARLAVTVKVRAHSRMIHHNHPVGRGAGHDIHQRNIADRALFHQLLEETRL